MLPRQKQALIITVAKMAKKPVILVMICGGPVDISFAKRELQITMLTCYNIQLVLIVYLLNSLLIIGNRGRKCRYRVNDSWFSLAST